MSIKPRKVTLKKWRALLRAKGTKLPRLRVEIGALTRAVDVFRSNVFCREWDLADEALDRIEARLAELMEDGK